MSSDHHETLKERLAAARHARRSEYACPHCDGKYLEFEGRMWCPQWLAQEIERLERQLGHQPI